MLILQLKLFYQYEKHMMMKILQDVHSLLLDDRICSITTPPRIVGGVGIRTGWMDRWVAQYFSAYKWMASNSTKVSCSELFYIMD